MVLERQLPEGHEELRGEQQHRQRLIEGQQVVHQPQADLKRHQGGGGGSGPLHHQRGLEGGGQHFHGGVAELPADVADIVHLLPAAAEELQRGQSLQHVQEEGAHPTHLGKAAGGQRARAAADEGQQQQQHGPGEQEHQRGPGVNDQHQQENQDGGDSRHVAGGQELGDVTVERFHAGHGGVDQLSAALALGVGRAELQQMAGQPAAHVGFQPAGGLLGGRFEQPEQAGAADDQPEHEQEEGQQGVSALAAQEDAVDNFAEGQRLARQQQAGQHAIERGQPDQQATAVVQPAETPVNAHGQSSKNPAGLRRNPPSDQDNRIDLRGFITPNSFPASSSPARGRSNKRPTCRAAQRACRSARR